MQSDIEHINYVQNQEHYNFDITPLGGGVAKEDRIKNLIPVFEGGRMYLPAGIVNVDYEGRAYDPVVVFVDEEYRDFPVSLHDDMFDGLARIIDPDMQLQWPASHEEIKKKRDSWGNAFDADESPGFMGR